MIGCGVDEFLEVGFGFEEVVDARLLRLITSTADVLDDVTFEVVEILIDHKIPNFDATLLVVTWTVLAHRCGFGGSWHRGLGT